MANGENEVMGKPISKIRSNPWILATIFLVVVLFVVLVVRPGSMTGNVINENDASEKLVDYLNSIAGGGVEYVSSEDAGNLYQVTVSYQGQQIPVFITKDGNYFIQGATPITAQATNQQTQETPQNVPKSDKPKVSAYIFSYCPYGLQFEKALIPVYNLLKDKADINIVAIGAMHGEFEKTESLRQISIEQLYGKDKLFAYLNEFNANRNIGSCSGDESCLNRYLPAIYSKLGIDKSKVENYMATNAESIYNKQGAEASSLGISGSPTFVINGVKVSVARTPDAIKQAICGAFNTPPSECSQTLSSASPSAGFGGTSGASTGATC